MLTVQINMNIVMTVRSSCELETYIVAVERIKEYTELPSEVSHNAAAAVFYPYGSFPSSLTPS